MRQNILNISPVCKYFWWNSCWLSASAAWKYFWLSETFWHCVYILFTSQTWSYIESEAEFDFWTLCILYKSQTLELKSEAVALGNLVSYSDWFWIWHKLIGGCRLKPSLYLGQPFVCRYFSQAFGHFWSHFVKGQVQLWASESHVFTAAVEALSYQQNGCITWHWDQYFVLFTL